MDYEQILYEVRGDVAWITLNRPDRLNAWTPRMGAEQADAMERANEDPSTWRRTSRASSSTTR